MSQPITVDLHDLASVRVSKYTYDTSLEQVTIKYKVQAYKTRRYKTYTEIFQVTPEENAAGTEDIVNRGWQRIWEASRNQISQFVEAESQKHNVHTAYQVPTSFPPLWVTEPELGDYISETELSIQLHADMAVRYESTNLPEGMTLNVIQGHLAGKVSSGLHEFNVLAFGGSPTTPVSRTFRMRVVQKPVWATDTQLPDGLFGSSATVQLSASGAADYTVVAGALPPGISMTSSGLLTGSAQNIGRYNFTVRAAMSTASTFQAGAVYSDQEFAWNFGRLPLWQTLEGDLDACIVDRPLHADVLATYAYKYSLLSGVLPIGCRLDSDLGAITGTPGSTGTYAFVVRAIGHAESLFADRSFAISVVDIPVWDTTYLDGIPQDVAAVIQLRARNTQEYAVVSGSLPGGISLVSSTGYLLGTAGVSGSYSFTVRAYSSSSSIYADRSFRLEVARKPIWVTDDTLPAAARDAEMSRQLYATGAHTYELAPGSQLPHETTLSQTGMLTGVPIESGDFTFTVYARSLVRDVMAARTFGLQVAVRPTWPEVPEADSVPDLTETARDEPLEMHFVARNAAAYVIVSGNSPIDVSMSGSGVLSGIPSASGSYFFVLRALSNVLSIYEDKPFTVRVSTRPVWTMPTKLRDAATDEDFSVQFQATSAVEYTLASGAVPTGCVLTTGGALVGIPRVSGPYSFSIRALSDSPSVYADSPSFIVDIARRPVWDTATIPSMGAYDPLTPLQFIASATEQFAVISGSLPDGLELSPTGLLTGTPTTAVKTTVKIRATGTAPGVYADRTFTFSISVWPVWPDDTTLVEAARGVSMVKQLSPLHAISYEQVAGTLPPGLSLTTLGALTGTPTNTGAYAFTVRAVGSDPEIYADRVFYQDIVDTPVWTGNTKLPDSESGSQVSLQLYAMHGVWYEHVAGLMPPGMQISMTGTLSGSPMLTNSNSGTNFSFTIAAYSQERTLRVEKTFAMLVASKPVWTTPAALDDTARTANLSVQLVAQNADSYAVMSGDLPPDVTLTRGGLLSGAPSSEGHYSFTVRAYSQSTVVYTDQLFSLFVDTVPAWSTESRLRDMELGTDQHVQLVASDTSRYEIMTGSLPPGLQMSQGGLLTGTPTTEGEYAFLVRAYSDIPTRVYTDLEFRVLVAETPVWVTPPALTAAPLNQSVTRVLAANNAVKYTVVSGELPTGLALSPQSGVLDGVPTAPGTFTFSVRATSLSSLYYEDSVPFTMIISSVPEWVTARVIPDTLANVATTIALFARNTVRYAVQSGTLPSGMSLSAEGMLAGSPQATGQFTFTIRAYGTTDLVYVDKEFTVLIGLDPIWTTAASLVGRQRNVAFSVQLIASYAVSYSLVDGTLPTGVSINAAGLLSGTPSASGTFSFTVKATGASPTFDSDRIFVIVIDALPVWSTTSVTDVERDFEVSFQFVASAVRYDVTSGQLPTGTELTTLGLLRGIATENGTFSFTVRATSAVPSVFTDKAFTCLVASTPVWTTADVLPAQFIAVPMTSQQLTATYAASFSFTPGTLPPGTNLSTTGLLSGTPNTAGNYVFTIKATSASTRFFSFRTFSMVVESAPTWTTANALNDTLRGAQMSVQLAATRGATYEMYNGTTLPYDLALSSSGVLSGVPSTNGPYAFTVRTRTVNGTVFSDRTFSLLVASTPVWVTATIQGLLRGAPMNPVQLDATYGVTYKLQSGTLPTDVQLSTGGLLTGTPSQEGVFYFTIRCTSASALFFSDAAFSIVVTNVPAWSTSPDLGVIPRSVPTSQALIATSTSNYTVQAGVLPTGLVLDEAAGLLDGTPTALEGNYKFTIRATSASPLYFADREFTIRIETRPIWATPALLTPIPHNVPFTLQLSAAEATSYATVTSLPPALAMSTSGLITGTPTTKGSFGFTISANSDSVSVFTERQFAIVVAGTPVWSTTSPLPDCITGLPIALQLSAGADAARYEVFSGDLPPGLTLSPAGMLGGQPIVAGAYSWVVRAYSVASNIYTDRTFALLVENRPVWVTPTPLSDALKDASMNVQLEASDSVTFAPIDPTGLPPGVTLTSAGLLGGKPTLNGSYTFTVRARARTAYADKQFSILVASNPVWITTSAAFPDAQSGIPLTVQFAATDASTFVKSSGEFPIGLAMTRSGLLTGSPTSLGVHNFTINAISASPSIWATRSFSLLVASPPVWQTPATLDPIVKGSDVSVVLTATHAVRYDKLSGSTPTSSGVSGEGAIAGIADTTGTFTFVVRATSESTSLYTDKQFTCVVGINPAWVTNSTFADAPKGVMINTQLIATYGVTFTVVEGALPPGLTLALDGTLTGTPSTECRSVFRVRAGTNHPAFYTDKVFSMAVETVPSWSTPQALTDSAKDVQLNLQFVATDAESYSHTSGDLPIGVSVSANGLLSGTPGETGVFTFTLRALTTSPVVYADRTFTWKVATLPVWATAGKLVDSPVGDALYMPLVASDTASYAVVLGALPTGLSLSGAGTLSGTPSVATDSAFTVRAYRTGSPAVYLDRAFTITVMTKPLWVTASPVNDVGLTDVVNASLTASEATSYEKLVGTFPDGLSMSQAGVISGTTQALGTWYFTIRAYRVPSVYADRSFTMTVVTKPAWLTSSPLTDAPVGDYLTVYLSATNGASYELASGTLPTGLKLTQGGAITGIPTQAMASRFTVRALRTGPPQVFSDKEFTLNVVTKPVWVTSNVLTTVAQGRTMSVSLVATNGASYMQVGGTRPQGTDAITSSGVLAGTPNTAGMYSFTVRAFRTGSPTVYEDRTFSQLVVTEPVWQTAPSLVDAGVGDVYVCPLVATNGETYTRINGVLPKDISLSSAGVLTGTLSEAATSVFTVRVTRAGSPNITVDREFTLKVVTKPVWVTQQALPDAGLGDPLSITVSATNGTSYSIISGFKPEGLADITTGGVLAGLPSAAGQTSFTVRALRTGSPSVYTDQVFTLTVVTKPVWITTSLTDVPVGDICTIPLVATDASRYSLPSGSTQELQFATTGSIAGTPSSAVTRTFTVRAHRSGSEAIYTDINFTLTSYVMHATVADWLSRVRLNGGSSAPSLTKAVNTMIIALDSAGVLSKMLRFNAFSGDQLSAALVPIKRVLGSPTDGPQNVVETDYVVIGGITGDGSSKYIDTGVNLNAVSINGTNMHMAVNTLSAANGRIMGVASQGATRTYSASNGAAAFAWGTSGARTPAASAGEHIVVSRSTAAAVIYVDGSQTGSIPSPDNSQPADFAVTVLGSRYSATGQAPAAGVNSYSSCRISCYSIGYDLTSAEAQAYKNAMTAFNTSMGRTIPLNAITVSWLTRVASSGGSVAPTIQTAVNNLVNMLEAAGLLAKMVRLNLFTGDQLAAALVPLIGSGSDTAGNLVSGDYTVAGGIKGNGSNKYVDTNTNFNAVSTNGTNMHFSLTALSAVNGRIMGSSRQNVFTRHYMFDGGFSWGNGGTRSPQPSGPEHMIATRDATGSALFYSGGTQTGSHPTPDGSQPADISVIVLAHNQSPTGTNVGGAVNSFSTSSVGGYSIGYHLSAAQAAAYRNAISTFNTALGRAAV